MLGHDFLLFLRVYLILFILQLIALPLIILFSKKFKFLKDAGWGFARFIALLFLSFTIWQLGHLKIPINNKEGIYFIFSILIFYSLFFIRKFYLKDKNFLSKFFKKYKKIILIEEFIFLFSLIFILAMRSFQPEILGLEKFMDAGFIQSYLKSPTLPVKDIWLANENINYYSFGQFYNSILVQLWQIDMAYAYNFLLASIFSLMTIESFSLAFNLRSNLKLRKKNFFKKDGYNFKAATASGILAVFLLAFAGNGHSLWYFFQNNGFDSYWYPDATRFIEGTIHEFPSYSFVVCDLHAHVLSLPMVLLLIFLLFIWFKELMNFSFKTKIKKFFKERYFITSIIIGFLFGILGMTNTWDMMVYGFFIIILSLILLLWNKKYIYPLFLSALAVFLGTLMTILFWYLNFNAIAQGLKLTEESTPFWQLLVLWGPHFFWALMAFIVAIFKLKKKKTQDKTIFFFLISAFILVTLLIAFPEFFYFKDIYLSHQRANTMFKLVFQAFIVLSLILSVFFTVILPIGFSKRKNKKFLLFYLPISFFLFFSSLAYPFLAYKSYYAAWKNYQGLNGLAWFERTAPDDFAMISYLKTHEDQQVNIVEAVGESYSQYGRISAFSGMPTILGWRVHEWLWRGAWDIPGQRTTEVMEIYNHPNSILSKSYLKKYQIKYIVLGDKERETYQLELKSLLSLGEIVFHSADSYLIKLY